MSLTQDRARALLAGFPEQRIFVIGDLMLDRYVHGQVDRISPEAPVPVVHVEKERAVPGGACNVAMNLTALGANAELAGIIGSDAAGQQLLDILGDQGVGHAGVIRSNSVETITKTRILAGKGNQQICRVDREGAAADFAAAAEQANFHQQLGTCSGLILEDYGKGALTANVVTAALDAAKANHVLSGIDPKENRELDFSNATVVKPNRREALQLAGLPDHRREQPPLEDPILLGAGHDLLAKWQSRLLLVTLGPDGLLLFGPDATVNHIPTRAREVFDVSGAGDTVIATFMAALCAGASETEAAELANVAAGLVVAKLGTATCSPTEILDALA